MRLILTLLVLIPLIGCSAATVTETYERTPASAKTVLRHTGEGRTETRRETNCKQSQNDMKAMKEEQDPFLMRPVRGLR